MLSLFTKRAMLSLRAAHFAMRPQLLAPVALGAQSGVRCFSSPNHMDDRVPMLIRGVYPDGVVAPFNEGILSEEGELVPAMNKRGKLAKKKRRKKKGKNVSLRYRG
eukprot:TRINITY_DN2976_c0_g1_i1.p2 TRINITY_DN2976_c0_g1~~TRINITY_DN2976_c0_g1_i1.p2  ORF type:complete len:106 (-),score=30.18 TRINITY_DN2976_c0_g1_i1:426-743(-)